MVLICMFGILYGRLVVFMLILNGFGFLVLVMNVEMIVGKVVW